MISIKLLLLACVPIFRPIQLLQLIVNCGRRPHRDRIAADGPIFYSAVFLWSSNRFINAQHLCHFTLHFTTHQVQLEVGHSHEMMISAGLRVYAELIFLRF
jgi:hypothetical protein